MASKTSVNARVASIRQLLRDLHDPARLARNPLARRLVPDVGPAEVKGALLALFDAGLYRLPRRQRELIRRHDLEREPAIRLQQQFALSQRQFYRDRHEAMESLANWLAGEGAKVSEFTKIAAPAVPVLTEIPAYFQRTLASAFRQAGDHATALNLLEALLPHVHEVELAAQVELDMAELALEVSDAAGARDLVRRALRSLDGDQTAAADYVRGRAAALQATLATAADDAASYNARALALLRRSCFGIESPKERRVALAEVLGRMAIDAFDLGRFEVARATSHEAMDLVRSAGLQGDPVEVSVVTSHAAIDACVLGRVSDAIALLEPYFSACLERGWYSLVAGLGGQFVGLNCLRSRYSDALSWFDRLSSAPLGRLRAEDRKAVAVDAGHAFTMLGAPERALDVLDSPELAAGAVHMDTPMRRMKRAEAFERLDRTSESMSEATLALEAFGRGGSQKGAANAHRVLAICHAREARLGLAVEHLNESRRLVERHGTLYMLLRTLVTEANIRRDPQLKGDAVELAQHLLALGGDPAPVVRRET